MGIRKGSISHRIFDFLRQRKASTIEEMSKELNLPRNYFPRYLEMLLNQDLIVASDRKIQSVNRKCSRVRLYGLTMEDIRRREKEILSNMSEEQFLDMLYKKVYYILINSKNAMTPYEVLLEIQKEKPDYFNLEWIGTVCRDLWKRRDKFKNPVLRSPFRIPPECLPDINTKRGSYVYGTSKEQIKRKVLELAPKEVRDSYNRIVGEAKLFASFYLKQLTGISITQDDLDEGKPLLKKWLIDRFYKAGWINYRTYRGMGYFWRIGLPEDMVERQIRELHTKAVEYRLGTAELGRMSEARSLFTFVMYAKLVWNRNIVLPEEFPKGIPSWFNKKHIEKYTHIDKSVNGRERRVLDCSVWKFDLNPIDYLVFEKIDENLHTHPSAYVLNMKFTTKKIGENFLSHMVNTIKEGFMYKYRTDKGSGRKIPKKISIPEHGSLKPVIICKSTYGGIVWQRAKDYGAIIITLSKLQQMEKHLKECFGIEYADSKKVDEMMEKVRLYEYYQQNALALGKDAVAMVKEAVK